VIKKIVSRLKINTTPELLTVSTIEEAEKYRHIGGPTVQVNGIDIEPAARTIEQFALA
jgi:hypothetical protein